MRARLAAGGTVAAIAGAAQCLGVVARAVGGAPLAGLGWLPGGGSVVFGILLTAASSDHEQAASARTGRILVAHVDSSRAGLP